ncbi:hypothetical protein GQ61_05810 [Candidatus Nucleicultrix amoebiphila FS5]|uniref:Uncharacterized protein n=1 Tax=Candidatus Nucleicultrix amoebiphila FS5 TaxID=1414854 RepID=A0A1W6N4Y6_9PROT|nr:hypothetical protein GQ61_05810 [Candidatus Nucleicultrix amoebiphila FS5]
MNGLFTLLLYILLLSNKVVDVVVLWKTLFRNQGKKLYTVSCSSNTLDFLKVALSANIFLSSYPQMYNFRIK